MSCAVCGQPSHVHDLEDDVLYCDDHADERLICAKVHEHLVPTVVEEPAP